MNIVALVVAAVALLISGAALVYSRQQAKAAQVEIAEALRPHVTATADGEPHMPVLIVENSGAEHLSDVRIELHGRGKSFTLASRRPTPAGDSPTQAGRFICQQRRRRP